MIMLEKTKEYHLNELIDKVNELGKILLRF